MTCIVCPGVSFYSPAIFCNDKLHETILAGVCAGIACHHLILCSGDMAEPVV